MLVGVFSSMFNDVDSSASLFALFGDFAAGIKKFVIRILKTNQLQV